MGFQASQLLAIQIIAAVFTPDFRTYTRGALSLRAAVLILLAFLFWLMLNYSNRVAQTGPLATQVKEALSTVHQDQVLRSLAEKWETGEYHRQVVCDCDWLSANPLPVAKNPDLEQSHEIQSLKRQALVTGRIGTFAPGGVPETVTAVERAEHVWVIRIWGDALNNEAMRRYREEQQQGIASARSESVSTILDSFDFGSLWGQGPQFVLQFTAVVTIIFAVLALAILQQMSNEQSGTILAAIAGYVLGHASTKTRPGSQ